MKTPMLFGVPHLTAQGSIVATIEQVPAQQMYPTVVEPESITIEVLNGSVQLVKHTPTDDTTDPKKAYQFCTVQPQGKGLEYCGEISYWDTTSISVFPNQKVTLNKHDVFALLFNWGSARLLLTAENQSITQSLQTILLPVVDGKPYIIGGL